jgi:hypothetical protein
MRAKSVPYQSQLTAYTRRLSIPSSSSRSLPINERPCPEYRLPKALAQAWNVRSRECELYTYVGEQGMLISPDQLPPPNANGYRIKAQFAVRAIWKFANLVGIMENSVNPISFLTWQSGKNTDRVAIVNSPVLLAKHLGEFSINAVPGMVNTDWERIDGFRLRLADSLPGNEVRLGTAPLHAQPADIVYGAFSQLFEGAYSSNLSYGLHP